MSTPPKIITFYSYKGGVGRTMALANVAYLLSKKYNVLVVDWDLEAPGLHKFFDISEETIKKGLIDIFYDYKELLRDKNFSSESDLPNIDPYIKLVDVNSQGNQISILPAGSFDEDYATKVNSFNWDDFYKIWYGHGFIEYLKKQFKNKADFILIDSRTGVTDIGGICTLQIPDAVVLLFSLNEQNIQGTKRIIKSINRSSKLRSKEEPPRLFIIPSRVERDFEMDLLAKWSGIAAQTLGEFIENNSYKDPIKYINETLIPHISYYTFGEKIAVKRYPDDSMAKAYKNLTKIILKEFTYEPLEDEETLISDLTVNKTDDYEIWITKGLVFSQSRMFDKAIKSFDESLKIKPDNAEIWFNKGIALFSLQRNEEALIAYNKAIDLEPNYEKAWFNKGIVLSSLNRKIEALETFERAINLKVDCVEAWLNKGNILSSLCRWTEALTAYEKAIDIKPDYVQAWFNKGVTLTLLGRTEEAFTAYDHLVDLSNDIIKLKKINELNISERQISKLPPEISKLKYLCKLNISKNKLSILPHEIVELKDLTELYMSENQLISLPSEIFELKNLTKLNLFGNRLTTLPPEISKLRNLNELDVSGNQLTSLPFEIIELTNLTKLNISGNQLTMLPPEISKLRNLNELDVSGNQLTSLPFEIIELTNLTKLNISGNQLTMLPPEISKLVNLIELDLSGNQLTSLPPKISELKNLTKLNILENQLTSLPPEITELKNLTELYISFNQLTSLPPEITELKNLTQLDISGNQLTSLPPEILELDLDIMWEYQVGKKGIILGGNPLENPPLEIVKQGRGTIINYFKSLEGGNEPLNEVKVLLVGDGGAGKTSLVKRLVGEGFYGNEHQTQGINIKKWRFKDKDKEIKVNFWDFGGQEIMHATHQFFLSKRSLYILVLDSRRDEKAEYWLKHIRSFGGDSPVLIVLNKIDENPSFELNRKFLQEKYPSIKGFFRVSCKEFRGIEIFSRKLQKELSKMEPLQIKWAKSWFNVKTRLENMNCDFITYTEYQNMCLEEHVGDKSAQNTLLDFLNDLGVVVHFKDISLLDTHVLEPRWITEGVYKIINSEILAKNRGVLRFGMLDEILEQKKENDYYYPPARYDYIINLMKKFELCYAIDDETVLLPDLLAVPEPSFNFDSNGALKFFIEYDFLPRSVMPRFIVKMNRDIKNGLQWRTGMVLENKDFNSCAVIKSDNEAKRIYINVNGGQKRDYFSSILFNLREINNSFEKVKAVDKIPLPGEPDVAVSYDHLVFLEEIGEDKYRPEGSKKVYSVKDLLGMVNIRRTEYELIEEILHILNKKNEENKLEEIVPILTDLARDQAEESDNWETLSKKLIKTIMVQPNITGSEFNFNEAIDLALDRYFKWKKKNK